MLLLPKFFCPGPMWPLSAWCKYTSHFENGVILAILRLVTFFHNFTTSLELLGCQDSCGGLSDCCCFIWCHYWSWWWVGCYLPERMSHAGPWVEESGWLWWTELGYWCWQLSLLTGCQALEQVMLSHSFFHSAIPVGISKVFFLLQIILLSFLLI